MYSRPACSSCRSLALKIRTSACRRSRSEADLPAKGLDGSMGCTTVQVSARKKTFFRSSFSSTKLRRSWPSAIPLHRHQHHIGQNVGENVAAAVGDAELQAVASRGRARSPSDY